MNGTVLITGAGGIGRAVALILATNKAMQVKIYIGDADENQLKSAGDWIRAGAGSDANITEVLMSKGEDSPDMLKALQKADILLDCLPGSLAPKMAGYAVEHELHYVNLTEYVKETAEIEKLAANAKTGFVLQTGLAPGYINILAHKLYQDFQRDFETDELDEMQMKVGALSQYAKAPFHYAFTWSPIGVATEYVKDAIVVRNFEKVLIPALSGRNLITIGGTVYEDNFTSGGAANLPEAFAGKVKNLDYKTLRYPGHYQWVEETLHEIPMSENRIQRLFDIMLASIPTVEDDVVVIYASVTGKGPQGMLRSYERGIKIYPSKVGTKTLRAIQTSTAAPMCEMAYFLLSGKGKSGIIYQTDIDPDIFLNGPYVSAIYGEFIH
jgi:saccharopine dehydrogenase-like NADP-dependent oxidoreductase